MADVDKVLEILRWIVDRLGHDSDCSSEMNTSDAEGYYWRSCDCGYDKIRDKIAYGTFEDC